METRPYQGEVGLQFISTGTVQVRPGLKSQPIQNRSVTLRRLRAFTDRQWCEPMPIGVFIVYHPNGPILFDTGESPLCNNPGYRPIWSPTRLVAKTQIAPEHGIVAQLRVYGIEPTDLQAIVLSHLHGDHAGGLPDIAAVAPNVPVYVSREHWDEFGNNYLHAVISGCSPQHWPKDFAPRLLEFQKNPIGPWEQSCNITPDGAVVVVATPGHVRGHVSLVVRGGGGSGDSGSTTYFLPGDATYGIDVLDKEEPDGVNDDPETALQTLRLIKQFARLQDVVVLPSHDVDTPRLLRERVVYKPK